MNIESPGSFLLPGLFYFDNVVLFIHKTCG
jgi:hypothetical protein